jgi:hypothetical protein
MCFHLEQPVSCAGTLSPVASLLSIVAIDSVSMVPASQVLKVVPDGGR